MNPDSELKLGGGKLEWRDWRELGLILFSSSFWSVFLCLNNRADGFDLATLVFVLFFFLLFIKTVAMGSALEQTCKYHCAPYWPTNERPTRTF